MIFAVTSGSLAYYKKFAEFIGQPKSVGELKSNAVEMKQLIETQYDSISRELRCYYLHGLRILININNKMINIQQTQF